jgi:hypothetical protein
MHHRDRHAKACAELFANFSPDVSTARNPALVLKVRDLAAQGLYSYEIAQQVGKTPKAVQKIFRRYGFPRLHNLEPPRREERIGWAGGTKIVKGYAYARTPGHPFASKHGGYVAVHRLVMEKKIGRHLQPGEVVDHIDGNPLNNEPENLRLFASNGEHLAATLKGKCPNWSEQGKQRIRDAVKRRHRLAREKKAAASHQASTDDAGLSQ